MKSFSIISLLPSSKETKKDIQSVVQTPTIAFEDITKKDLYELAQITGLEGRSHMNKEELYNSLKTKL